MVLIAEPFHLIHKTELTTPKNEKMEKDGLYGQQEQAIMSTAGKRCLKYTQRVPLTSLASTTKKDA